MAQLADRFSAFFKRRKKGLFPELFAVALVLCLLLFSLHREVLFGGAIYHMDDAADNYYPARVAFLRALHEGTLPSWEKNTMGGWPLLSDPYYGYFYPLNFVFYLGPKKGEPPSGLAGGVAAGLGLSAVLHAFLAGLGMHIYLRGRKARGGRRLSFLAALFGAIAFALSSFLVVRIRHIIYVQMMAWVPFLLAAIDRYIETASRKMLAACALLTGLLFLAGAHSLVHFVALILVFYTIARLGRGAREQPREKRLHWLLSTFFHLSLAALFGVLISAVALLPTLFALPASARALGTDYAFASSYAWPSWRYAQLLLFPDAFGIGEWRGSPQPFRGPWNHWELAGYYQGVLALLFAIPGGILGLWRRDFERLALLLLSGLAVLIALGDAGPVHPFLFKHLPLYGALRCPARALCMLVVAIPILAAHGADAVAYDTKGMPRAWGLLFLFGLCAGTALDQYHVDRRYVQPKPIDYAYGTERFAAVEWLRQVMPPSPNGTKADKELVRFVSDGRGPFRLLSLGETLGLESASGYSSMLVWRYVHLLYILNHGTPYPHARLRYDPAAGQFLRLDSPLLDMLNVRYLIASERPSEKWVERYRKPLEAPPHARHEPIWDAVLRVYENTQVMPRAYVAYAARLAKTEAEEAAAIADPHFDPHREIVLGGWHLKEPPAIENRGRAHSPAAIRSHERHRVVIEAEAAASGVLVLGDTFFPGWSAKVDGVAQPIYAVNLAQRGVALEKGRHVIEFVYRDRALFRGGLLSFCGLLGTLLLLVLAKRGSRTKTPIP